MWATTTMRIPALSFTLGGGGCVWVFGTVKRSLGRLWTNGNEGEHAGWGSSLEEVDVEGNLRIGALQGGGRGQHGRSIGQRKGGPAWKNEQKKKKSLKQWVHMPSRPVFMGWALVD